MSRKSNVENSDELRLERNLTYRLARLQNKLNAQAAQILKNHGGPTLTDWRVLRILDSVKEASLAEIVSRSHMDKGQLSRRISALVRDGLVASAPDAQDHRKFVLTLSQQGQDMHDRILPAMRARRKDLSKDFSKEEFDQFLNMLERINVAADNRDH